MKRFDVTALGELLIDFTENGKSSQGNIMMEANPGGAPCNVLAILTKLNKKTAFIGKVGDDYLGHHLQQVVEKLGINTENLLFDKEVHTTLAFVHTFEDGDRDFSFYRNPGADMNLRASEINEAIIADSKIFHFGTLSMTDPEVRKATEKAVDIAEKQIQVSPTRKEFEGHLTIMVFPFMKQTGKKNPEELGKEIGDWLVANLPIVGKYNVVKGFLNLSINASSWIYYRRRNG